MVRLLGAMLLGLAAAGAAQATVDVRFVEPDKFIDAGDSKIDRDRMLEQLGDFMKTEVGRRVPGSQDLLLEVLDVDLAGAIEPRGRSMDRIRVIKDIYGPAITLCYKLSEGGKSLREGQSRLTDIGFMQSLRLGDSSEALYYEKRLLNEWFDKEFGAPPKR